MKDNNHRIELVNQPLSDDLIRNYVKYADIFESPTEAHEAVMQTLIAAVVNPNVHIVNEGQKLSLDFWTLLLSPSSLGRNTLVSLMRNLLRSAEIKGLVKTNTWGSVQGLYQNLAERPNAFFVWEEFSIFLKLLESARFANAKEWLTDRYDNLEIPESIAYRKLGRSSDTPSIIFTDAPRICTLATSSYEWFTGMLSESDALGGFIPRWFIVDLPKSDKCIPSPKQPDPEYVDGLVGALKRAAELKGPADISGVKAEYEEWYRAAKERFENQEQYQLATIFFRRHRVHLLKLAAIYEISQTGNLVVSSSALERAISAARRAEDTICALLASGCGKEGAAVEKLYQEILRAGEHGLPKSTLTRLFTNAPPFVREQRITTLVDSERVFKCSHKTQGRPAEVYVADTHLERHQALHHGEPEKPELPKVA